MISQRKPFLTAIAAMGRNRVIGSGGCIPWNIPVDLVFFRRQTQGHTVIMGRKTWESIGSQLKKRRNIVLSRTMPETEGVEVVRSVEELLGMDLGERPFVIGGEEIYRLLLPWTREILLTEIEDEPEGDAFFPEIGEEFEHVEVLDRIDGLAEWGRFVRK